MSDVAAVVIWTPGDPDPGECLESLAPQVGELVLVENPGGSPSAPGKTRVLRNERTLGFGANINKGTAATEAPYVVASNADIEATPGSIAALLDVRGGPSPLRDRRAADALPRRPLAAVAPQLPDGARARSSAARRCAASSTPRRARRSTTSSTSARPSPSQADWLLGAFLFLRREMLDELGGMDEGYHLYGDDIDLAYRARKTGWERWYVPDAVVVHHHQAVTDRRYFTRRTLWHWRSMLRFVRKHPESLRQL